MYSNIKTIQTHINILHKFITLLHNIYARNKSFLFYCIQQTIIASIAILTIYKL